MIQPEGPLPIPELDTLPLVLASYNLVLVSLSQALPGNNIKAPPGTWLAHLNQAHKGSRPPPSYASGYGRGYTPTVAIRSAIKDYLSRIARNSRPTLVLGISLDDLDI